MYFYFQTGLTLVDLVCNRMPDQKRDDFWEEDHVIPLYSLEAAKRTVHPMIGSASKIKLKLGVNPEDQLSKGQMALKQIVDL